MKGERRLKLVPPPGSGDAEARADASPSLAAEEAPPTEAELREASALREAIEQGVDPLATALRSARSPDPLDEVDHDALLARVLGDVDDAAAPPTKAEKREAERLAGEIDAMTQRARAPSAPMSDGAETASALRAAWAPRPIEPLRNEALIAGALRSAKAGRGRALSVTMVALSTLAAAAAAIALYVGGPGQLGAPARQTASAPATAAAAAQVALIRARSTTELFDPETPFPRTGGTSERIDRIAGARAADLRANRFAAWGVP